MKMKSAGVVDGGLFTESYCNICNAQLISESQRTAHYEVSPSLLKIHLDSLTIVCTHNTLKLPRSVLSQADTCAVNFALFVQIDACGVRNSAHPLYVALMQLGNASYFHTNTHTFTFRFNVVYLSTLE